MAINQRPGYQQLLDSDPGPVPDALREHSDCYLGSEPLTTAYYTERVYHQLEKERLWPRVWQAVCRETEVAHPGAFFSHEVAGFTVLVVRDEAGELHAFPNACLHRGRQLKSGCGSSRELRCPFHGFSWSLDGRFNGAPCDWDFPHIDPQAFGLPALRLETWGGWVFVNRDPEASSLADTLGVMAAHFQRWQPEQTYKALHVRKVVRCNWKLAHEAFIESFHTVATHPQLLPYTGDTLSQYDCFNDHVSRSVTPMGLASEHAPKVDEQGALSQWLQEYGVPDDGTLPPGTSARAYLGELNLRRFSALYGRELAGTSSHAEVLDSILYSIFPNFAPWAGFRPNLTYRFLPWDDRHDLCTMEVMLLMRFPEGQRPADAAVIHVGPDQRLADTPGIDAGLARVFDQDFANLPQLQRGLHSLHSGRMQLADYQEQRIRHFRNTLDHYLNSDPETPA